MNHVHLRSLALFDDYVAMAPDRRAQALAALAQQDPPVHRALVAMLAADTVPDVLDSPPDVLLARHGRDEDTLADPRLGTRLGPWRINRVIGTGGMGTVYEAQRVDGQYAQRVALKCIRQELTSERLIDSFRRERELLAGLEHPNIASLLDGGVDAAGRPWFAMRYVDGAPIDEWCDQRHYSLRQRVRLLLDACHALEYAHRHMVLHQDIKPSNLLVTDDGQLQLLDFGLARSLLATEHDARLAVSEGYTAPEAFAGAPPAVAMDVWSLGMVMYRLLCGSLPPAPRMFDVLRAEVACEAPVALSRLALQAGNEDARRRGVDDATRLSRRLAGDLDAITARCVAPMPGQRYPSMSALRDDLQRWLESRPVAARGGGRGYRAARFLRRHSLAAALAAVATLAVVGGGGFAAWQSHRAAQEAQAAAALSRIFEHTLGTATLSGLGDAPQSSRALLEQTERAVRSLSLDAQPHMLARGLATLARNYATVGDYSRATALAEEAAALQGGDAHAIAATQATLASLHNLQGQADLALHAGQAALGALGPRGDTVTRLQLMTEIARAHWNRTEYARADAMLSEALQLAVHAGEDAARIELLTLRGQWHLRRQQFARGEADLHQALALATPEFPLLATLARQEVANALVVQQRGREALPYAEAAAAAYRHRLGGRHPLTGRALELLASIHCVNADFPRCEALLQEARPIIEANYSARHPERARLLRLQATLLSQRDGVSAAAIDAAREAAALVEATYPPEHDAVVRAKTLYASLLPHTPGVDATTRRRLRDEAITLLDAQLGVADRIQIPLSPAPVVGLAELLVQRNGPGDLARARVLLESNRETLSRFPPAYYSRFNNEFQLASLLYRTGDLAQADAVSRAMLPALDQHQDTRNNQLILGNTLLLLATVAQQRGDREATGQWLQRLQRHANEKFGAAHPVVPLVEAMVDEFARDGRFASPVQ